MIVNDSPFQAWKRRKNYNPMRSASSKSHTVQSSSSKSSKSNSKSAVSQNSRETEKQLQKRSASFHYPDGSSRVTHSVYSSEEDFNDEDEDEEVPRLYEVNDDELFLAYDSGGVVKPKRTGSSSSTQSGSKLEALDNLVISTIFSVSTKLCLLSGKLVKNVQERTNDKEEEAMLQTLVRFSQIPF